MNNLFRFLQDWRDLILYYALTVAGILSITAIAGADMHLAYYLVLLMTAALLILLAVKFLYFRRRRMLLQSLFADMPYLCDMLPVPCNQTERDLFPLISALAVSSGALRQQLDVMQQEQLGYYTLWVHQIKTPIAAMLLVLGRMESPEAALLSQELFRIEQYADLALRYAKLTDIASDLVISECSVQEAVKEGVKKFALPFVYRHLSVSLPENDLVIRSDRRWLMFILEQLISNAAKYTQKGGVTITLTGHTLSVADTGIGIRSEDLPRIFEKGYTGFNGRVDSRASGVGLYLAKRAADALRIGITVASVPGQGTTVSLALPPYDAFEFLS